MNHIDVLLLREFDVMLYRARQKVAEQERVLEQLRARRKAVQQARRRLAELRSTVTRLEIMSQRYEPPWSGAGWAAPLQPRARRV